MHQSELTFFSCFYLFLREREREKVEEGQRGQGTEDLKQALCWQQRAQCQARTHKPWDHDLSWSQTLNWLSPPEKLIKDLNRQIALKNSSMGYLGGLVSWASYSWFQLSSWSHGLWIRAPCWALWSGSVLTVWSLLGILSLWLPAPPPLMLTYKCLHTHLLSQNK